MQKNCLIFYIILSIQEVQTSNFKFSLYKSKTANNLNNLVTRISKPLYIHIILQCSTTSNIFYLKSLLNDDDARTITYKNPRNGQFSKSFRFKPSYVFIREMNLPFCITKFFTLSTSQFPVNTNICLFFPNILSLHCR